MIKSNVQEEYLLLKKITIFLLLSATISCQSRDTSSYLSNNDSILDLPYGAHRSSAALNASLRAEKHAHRPAVKKWIRHFSEEGKTSFEQILKRGSLYKKHIHAILQRFNLPTHFYYLALIESHFKVDAKSSASAMGIWQFMSATAKSHGLRINKYIDERRDPWRSTVAAAIYLRDLNKLFDSWFLAMSAYNAGQGRIMNAILRSGTRDYWQLSKIKFIPKETRDYVPRFLAALIVAENPKRYGLNLNFEDGPQVLSVKVPSPVPLRKIAKNLGLSLKEFKTYNPHFLKNMTPPRVDSYRVWIPEHKRDAEESLARIEPTPLVKMGSPLAKR